MHTYNPATEKIGYQCSEFSKVFLKLKCYTKHVQSGKHTKKSKSKEQVIGETLKDSLFDRVMLTSMHSRKKKEEDSTNITCTTSNPHVYLGHARK